ncbi:hypothetical protein HU200_005921 [Digitaria exilis]|uniref:F-box domain-containing protein n=1 Tax=Digitaria exilis TaxID=1010633 RepID=A0A835FPW6_9POAL|nr:hypothetical protein HU200_005921 [Digitaria exilis]
MTDPCLSSRWADLPSDLLGRILQLLELPEALSVASVCTSWSSAASAAGVPCSHTPWLMSWSDLRVNDSKGRACRTDFRSLLHTFKVYDVTLSRGCSLAWCGASHGWLVAADELSNLLLCNPFTFATIPLPPITDFDCVEAVRDSEGSIVGYLSGNKQSRIGVKGIGRWFYQKVVLSCDPSQNGNYTAMLIHYDANQVSFAVAGEGCWRLASTIPQENKDRYADCVFHRGRFYTLTLCGTIEMWNLDGSCEPKKIVFFPRGDGKFMKVFLRFLVSTPWGHLLQISFLWSSHCIKRIRAQIHLVDIVKNRLVKLRSAEVFQEHAVFVGQNHSACLSLKNFPELKPNCVYFTRTWLAHREIWGFRSQGVGGVGIYNLQSRVLEEAFPYYAHKLQDNLPCEVWVTPNL